MLTATKLTKTYAEVAAVRQVSLTLEPGRIMALVGASGSGKSTLLNLLAGLSDADAGEVWLNGQRVVGPSEKLVAGHDDIRLVHQEYQLMPNVSVRENIAYALRFFEKAYRDFRVDQLLKLCRLTDVQDRIPRQVSGGEKQRTAIARAIADKPAVLLLDEPFSHLDLPNRLIVRDLLFDLVHHEQTSCLFVTHDASDALSLADTLGILRDGKLVQSGTPKTVYHQPATAYAARMTGLANIFKAKYLPVFGLTEPQQSEELICLRPEQVRLDEQGTPGTIRVIFFKGSHYELDVQVSRYLSLRLLTTRDDLLVNQQVKISFDDKAVWRLKS
ncbi:MULTISPECIES: ABC transporter ATP-binding protein [unclassified Spirosoma]|uniref:ABC transporter ATP-binding protein n=1 Tax=unclassified Spirosoma TaxID=2621999 RepID=UPI000967700B|nr:MULTISPECIES: ABC transporter ATP-binding protein [unclassified Spirosoma]MBN8825140.1 ABC transporter ATP-binding protein [Spirosoma sp.]OJW77170.1 MAG: Fe3+/spermidine/putrescine ABC transporter ATP-binding protein [Spirosoma sp. 48-14]